LTEYDEIRQYNEVRAWLAERFRIARAEGMLRHAEGGYSDADEVLSDPRMAMLAEDQVSPFPEPMGSTVGDSWLRWENTWIHQEYQDAGFRRIVEKPKEESR